MRRGSRRGLPAPAHTSSRIAKSLTHAGFLQLSLFVVVFSLRSSVAGSAFLQTSLKKELTRVNGLRFSGAPSCLETTYDYGRLWVLFSSLFWESQQLPSCGGPQGKPWANKWETERNRGLRPNSLGKSESCQQPHEWTWSRSFPCGTFQWNLRPVRDLGSWATEAEKK